MEPIPDEEYRQQLARFVRASDEKPKLVRQAERIIARLGRRDRFLDVGAGAGDVTIPLSAHFASTTVAEPNRVQVERFRREHPTFEVHEVTLERLDLRGEPFDFILCSHVLYYVPASAWLDVVGKLHGWLRPGGKLAVIMQSPVGEMAEFFQHFNNFHVDVIPLWDDVVARYGEENVEALYCRTRIQTASREEMLSIGLFLLMDPRFRERAAEVAEYHETHHRCPEGYCMHQGQITLVLTRPS
jgi:SAM-dependent methyltransferase